MKISLEHLQKKYGKTCALSDFSIDMSPGIYALLGPNGSGKSTLMNIITDNLKADRGEIFYEDENIPRENVLTLGPRFRALLGYMPQYPAMYGNFTVWDYMWYMATLKDLYSSEKRRKRKQLIAEEIEKRLCEVELLEVAHSKISHLSGGMKQRLALAQALLGKPSVIILDEPTAGLDPKQRIAVRNLIARIALDRIVLIATHVVTDIEFIAKSIILLKEGKIVDVASAAELSRKMEGKVWDLPLGAEDDVSAMEKNYRVVGILKNEENGNVHLRVLSNVAPTMQATPLSPTLEDYYLFVFGKV
ncbi:MAG: ATP-binding cassette domain-containing protein [Clostridia bacterium]|nr:ATP-binding cassette domain-containing protein [Clostridia bacterium]